MLLSSIISLLFSTLTVSSPLHRRNDTTIPLENEPWHLSHITVFEPAPNSINSAYIKFSISDPNLQLQLNTTCQYWASAGSSVPITPGEGYVSCVSPSVRFKYDGRSIYIVRSYSFPDARWVEPNTSIFLDMWRLIILNARSQPFGMNFELCFGNSPLSLSAFVSTTPPGTKKIQSSLDIICTFMCEFWSSAIYLLANLFSGMISA